MCRGGSDCRIVSAEAMGIYALYTLLITLCVAAHGLKQGLTKIVVPQVRAERFSVVRI